MSFTPGPWRSGRGYGAVVADVAPVGRPEDSAEVRAYGGHLVAESITREDRALIAAAPDMHRLLIEWLESVDFHAPRDGCVEPPGTCHLHGLRDRVAALLAEIGT